LSGKPRLGRWELLSESVVSEYGVFRIRKDVSRSPRTGQTHDFVVLDGPDWVNVIALTGAGELVLVRQFRHGTRSETLEIPGGGVEPADPSPLEAARRELREETGYASEDWTFLGAVQPNPAIQSNLCHTFLARTAVRAGEPEPDAGEDLHVELHPASDANRLVAEGEIRHSLVLAAFFWWNLHRQGGSPGAC
jgi:8-oxo-dGTP pyrophosphatase MutT (NUDIX family)